MLNEVRQPLSDVIDLYCRSVSESQITDTINILPTLAAAVVTDVMHAVQQASLLLLDVAACRFCL